MNSNKILRGYFLLFIIFFVVSCRNQKNNFSKNSSIKTCSFVKDSVDFGEGYSSYDQNKICLDTIFTFDYFRTPNVIFKELKIGENSTILNWNNTTINLSLSDSLVLQFKGKRSINLDSSRFTFKSAYEITIGTKKYLAVFLFPNGICSHLIPLPLILINDKNVLVKFINEDSIYSTNPAYFCDIDGDNELDFISIDYDKEKVRFYCVDKWNLKPKYSRKIKNLIDMVYIMYK